MRVLYVGEIIGKPGVFTLKHLLPKIREEKKIDFVVANADGATNGFGLGKNHSIYIHKLGVDVLTSGECIYFKKDLVEHIMKAPYLLRAVNYPSNNPGRGWRIYTIPAGKIAVVSILGQSGFNRVHLNNPFHIMTDLSLKIRQLECQTILVDFHATTTAEKNTFFTYMDGKVSAVIGSHFRTLTADAGILNRGTAYITDAGRTGSINSVGGMKAEIEIQKFITQVPDRPQDSWEQLELQGAVMEFDEAGKAVSIEAIRVPCNEKPAAQEAKEE